MRKKFVVLLSLTVAILCSCGTSKAEPEQQSQSMESEKSEISSTEYNKEIYSSDNVTIELTSIYSDRIEFNVTSNLKNNNISVLVDKISLDGKVPQEYYGSDDYWMDIEPGKTVTMNYYANMNFTEHNKMTACFEVFNDEGLGVEVIDIVEFVLGKTENEECEEPDGILVYDSQNLGISYVGADNTGIRLRINNKLNFSTTIGFDVPLCINGEEYEEYVSVMKIPAKSISDYYIYVKNFEPDYIPEDIETFSCSGFTYENEKFAISSDKAVEPTKTNNEQTKDSSDKPFVAKGEISLFSFLENASANGYEICNPERNGTDVSAEARGTEYTFDIEYMVEDQHIYKVEIQDVTAGNEFFDCICAMAKSINPDIEESVLLEAVEQAYISQDEAVVMGEMLFKFDTVERTFTIAH